MEKLILCLLCKYLALMPFLKFLEFVKVVNKLTKYAIICILMASSIFCNTAQVEHTKETQ